MNQGKVVQHQPHGVSKVSVTFTTGGLQWLRENKEVHFLHGLPQRELNLDKGIYSPGTLRLKVACRYTIGHSSYLHLVYLPFSVLHMLPDQELSKEKKWSWKLH